MSIIGHKCPNRCSYATRSNVTLVYGGGGQVVSAQPSATGIPGQAPDAQILSGQTADDPFNTSGLTSGLLGGAKFDNGTATMAGAYIDASSVSPYGFAVSGLGDFASCDPDGCYTKPSPTPASQNTGNGENVVVNGGHFSSWSQIGGTNDLSSGIIAAFATSAPLWTLSSYHDYTVADVLCSRGQSGCSLARASALQAYHNFPGQNPNVALRNGSSATVSLVGIPIGQVVISTQGTTMSNITLPEHALFYGSVDRTPSWQGNSLIMTTHGTGLDLYLGPAGAAVNEALAPYVWGPVDQSLSNDITKGGR